MHWLSFVVGFLPPWCLTEGLAQAYQSSAKWFVFALELGRRQQVRPAEWMEEQKPEKGGGGWGQCHPLGVEGH